MIQSSLLKYANATGLSIGLFRNAIAVLIGIPGFLLFKLVPDRPILKHWFSIIFTSGVFLMIYPWIGLLRIFLNCLFVHWLANVAKGKYWMPWVAFTITMVHLLVQYVVNKLILVNFWFNTEKNLGWWIRIILNIQAH